MARRHRKSCRVCHRHVSETGYISARGLCPEHSLLRHAQNTFEMKAGEGEMGLRWMRRLELSMRRRRIAAERAELT